MAENFVLESEQKKLCTSRIIFDIISKIFWMLKYI